MNALDAAKPALTTLLGLLKVGTLFAVPLLLVVAVCWFMFIRWSQHGVDL